MSGKQRLGVSDAPYLKPLLAGLELPDSPFEIASEIPAIVAQQFSDRPETFRGAFLSPIDYGRHGGDYQIIPTIAVSSSVPTQTIQLLIKDQVADVRTMAVDIRVTSEIILAKIILLEKYPNVSDQASSLKIVPMLPNPKAMLEKADAALIARVSTDVAMPARGFSLDLVEEWKDLTDLPYVHGFWVAREEHLGEEHIKALISSKTRGLETLAQLAARWAPEYKLSADESFRYLSSFSFDLGTDVEQSLSEFFRYAYYHGVLGDVPELNFFHFDSPPHSTIH
jgi:chorismate dehydratase